MHLVRRTRPFLAALVLALACSTGSASASVAGTTLPLVGFSHMLVDGAHGHVFVTGAAADSKIAVENEDGTSAGVITGESGAGGMVLDGGTLYVARCGWGVIDEIDTATLTKVGSFTAAVGGTCDLAEAGGRLWYSNSNDQQFGGLESVSLDSSHAVVDSGVSLYQMIFATTPAHPSWLIVGESDQSPTVVDVYDVTDPAAPTLLTHVFDLGGGGNLQDMAVTPDGSTLVTAAGAPYELDAFALPGLTVAGVYPTDNYPNAVAVSPSGAKIAGGSMSYYDNDVFLFETGDATPTTKWDFTSQYDLLYPRGLAFSADGTRLFSVSKGAAGTAAIFHVLPTVVLPKGVATIKASAATVVDGKAATLTAHLGTASTNRTVSIYRRPVGGTRTLVKTGVVNAAGNLSISVKPTANVAYTAVWGGDATHAATTSAAANVKVRLVMHGTTVGGYGASAGARLYHYSAACTKKAHTGCPRFTAYASPLLAGRTVTFVVQGRSAAGVWRKMLSGSYQTAANGRLGVVIFYSSRAVVGIHERIHFTIAKDSKHLGNTSPWVQFRVTS
ncbi:MAG TPA: hypothetical protein VGI72_05535 [Gaiellales bacterium]|jgi:hypothetical protein